MALGEKLESSFLCPVASHTQPKGTEQIRWHTCHKYKEYSEKHFLRCLMRQECAEGLNSA